MDCKAFNYCCELLETPLLFPDPTFTNACKYGGKLNTARRHEIKERSTTDPQQLNY